MVMPRHGACWIFGVCGDVCVSYASGSTIFTIYDWQNTTRSTLLLYLYLIL